MRRKCTNGNMSDCELLVLESFTLLRNEYANILRVVSIRQYMSEVSRILMFWVFA